MIGKEIDLEIVTEEGIVTIGTEEVENFIRLGTIGMVAVMVDAVDHRTIVCEAEVL